MTAVLAERIVYGLKIAHKLHDVLHDVARFLVLLCLLLPVFIFQSGVNSAYCVESNVGFFLCVGSSTNTSTIKLTCCSSLTTGDAVFFLIFTNNYLKFCMSYAVFYMHGITMYITELKFFLTLFFITS